MSDAMVYRCEWKKNYRGVYVETHTAREEHADYRKWIWHDSKKKAREAEASRMRWLAHELLCEADHLTSDERGL